MYWWIPVLIILNILAAYFTWKITISSDFKWQAFLYSLNFSPLWILVVKSSKNVFIDGILYDVILTVSYTLTLLFLTYGQMEMNMIHYIGLILIVLGFIVFKVA